MIVKAYAKINLAIKIKNKRKDGYHDLDMVVLPLELHDSIDISLLPDVYDSYVTCDDFALEIGQYNLCSIVIKKMKEKYNINKSFRIQIHKNIPIGAGLGGGSANAAAVIHAIKTLLKLDMSEQEELDLAKSIGADVPFCLRNIPAHVEGIGEKITPIEVKNKYYVLIVKPTRSLSTQEVYVKYDEMARVSKGNVAALIEALKEGTSDLSPFLSNDLEKPAIAMLPVIQDIKEILKEAGFANVLMSGSGSSVFAISENKFMVEREAKKLEKQGFNVFFTKVLTNGGK